LMGGDKVSPLSYRDLCGFITPGTKLMTVFSWRRIGRGVRENSF
jgi:hypothetical protein